MAGKKSDYKIINTLDTERSVLDSYWNRRGFKSFYKRFRRGTPLPKSIQFLPNSTEIVESKYNLRGFQFGNWTTVEDRFNYLAAIHVSFYDLNKVLKFKGSNIGLDGRLGIAFGARGRSGAVAHYEPTTMIINMTRYQRGYEDKIIRFINSGGVGALAHEYGHFIDYIFGGVYEPSTKAYALTNGRAIGTTRINYPPSQKMRNIVEDMFQQIFKMKYYTDIKAIAKKKYWYQRNEIFARLFEQYIAYKLKQSGIYNSFLSQTKYSSWAYMKPAELKKVIPYFDKLLVEMRKYF